MGFSVGIDLGTTNSAVAYVNQDRVETILNQEGSRITPSVVLFGEEIIVGDLAKRQAVTKPGKVIRSAKRLMGLRFEEALPFKDQLPFEISEGSDGRAEILLADGRKIPPELVSAQVLIKMRDTAEEFYGDQVNGAVITVPAHFNDAQRTATKRAAEIADIEVLRIVNEPTAAALAYGFGQENIHNTIAVFDLGGGTFDISILSISGDIFEVLSTNGDNHLGGDNIDEILIGIITRGIQEKTGINPMSDLTAKTRVREAAERAKIELSSLKKAAVSLPFIVSDERGPQHYESEISRGEYEEAIAPLIERLREPCRCALEDARISVGELHEVIMVGGSSRIPAVQDFVKHFFHRTPNLSVNPDEAVAIGAAIQGGVMRGELAELLLLDVTPLSLGIELAGGIYKPLIERNSNIPCEASRKFTTVVDNQQVVGVHVMQGERAIAAENRTLARFKLTGIPPMPKELPEVEVNFRIDADGILEVSAMELTSGVSAGIQVEGYGELASLSNEEIQGILESVTTHREKDEAFIRAAPRRAQAAQLQKKIDQLIELGADDISPKDMKTLKETLLRHDLAAAAHDWSAAETHEIVLNDYIDRYGHILELAELKSQSQFGPEPSLSEEQEVFEEPEDELPPPPPPGYSTRDPDQTRQMQPPPAEEHPKDTGPNYDETQKLTQPLQSPAPAADLSETRQYSRNNAPAPPPNESGQEAAPPLPPKKKRRNPDELDPMDEQEKKPVEKTKAEDRPLLEGDDSSFDFEDDFGEIPPPPPPRKN